MNRVSDFIVRLYATSLITIAAGKKDVFASKDYVFEGFKELCIIKALDSVHGTSKHFLL